MHEHVHGGHVDDATAHAQPPRRGPSPAYRWLVLIVISLAMFANYYVYDSIAPIADILKAEGYIAGYTVTEPAEGQVGKTLRLELKYGPARERSIAGLRRVSKPGLRVYAKSTNLPKVIGGLGIAIISTSQGLLTDRQAKKNGVGGEVLAYVW